jgi:hypothetical protein
LNFRHDFVLSVFRIDDVKPTCGTRCRKRFCQRMSGRRAVRLTP